MSGRDNAGQRVLNARPTLRGNDSCLENTFGRTLPDGAQCYVVDEQANYRFVKGCELPEDGQYVVVPQGDKFGRWIRAEGLVDFALLEGGKCDPESTLFSGYTYQRVVQFEVTPEALVYVGSVPRLAHLSAQAGDADISILLLQGKARAVTSGKRPSAIAMIYPGEQIVVKVAEQIALMDHPSPVVTSQASLQVVLA